MPTTVWRIHEHIARCNTYGVARYEEWTIEEDKTFEVYDDAVDYIRACSRIYTDMVSILGPGLTEKFVDDFCFKDPKYLIYRRFFIGYPPVDDIRGALRNQGIRVEKIPDS